jgi:glutamate dehydrogenase (NADP+)/cyclic pyranopterin phosphate synthase/molybdopterin-guanine dinucleotide biosynthesis protein A
METRCSGEEPLMTANAHDIPFPDLRSFASIRGLNYPAFGICGYSGSGKTTLIEVLIPRLRERGLKVGVIKQDAHGLEIDREGKDTDRLFKAGVDVLIRDAEQVFVRLHRRTDVTLPDLIRRVGSHYDLILVEGHKTTPLPCKIWLCKANEETCPPEAVGIRRVLGWTEDRVRIALDMLDAWLPDVWRAAPVYAGILIGGGSTRMGRPKHLIEERSETWLEKIVAVVRNHVDKVVILGSGEIPADLRSLPILPDVEDAEGPLRGMRAAMRWAPLSSWLFLPCDLPRVSPHAVQWLLGNRRPGRWVVLPVLPDSPRPEPLLAYYDFRAAALLERVRRPCECADNEKASTPLVPAALADAWKNVNTLEDLATVAPPIDVGNNPQTE